MSLESRSYGPSNDISCVAQPGYLKGLAGFQRPTNSIVQLVCIKSLNPKPSSRAWRTRDWKKNPSPTGICWIPNCR